MEQYLVENLQLGLQRAENILRRCEEMHLNMERIYTNYQEEVRKGKYHFGFRYRWMERLFLRYVRYV